MDRAGLEAAPRVPIVEVLLRKLRQQATLLTGKDVALAMWGAAQVADLSRPLALVLGREVVRKLDGLSPRHRGWARAYALAAPVAPFVLPCLEAEAVDPAPSPPTSADFAA